MSNAQHWIARKGQPLQGSLTIPGDKSVSHRSVMFAALADGTSHIEGFLEGEDTRATARIFSQLGCASKPQPVAAHRAWRRHRRPEGAGCTAGLRQCRHRHAAAGWPAGRAGVRLHADRRRVAVRPPDASRHWPAVADGRKDRYQDDGTPPLHVHGGQTLHGIDFASPVASAQIKSAVLLAGLYAQGETRVVEPHPTRDYTERMLSAFGVDIEFSPGKARLRAASACAPPTSWCRPIFPRPRSTWSPPASFPVPSCA